MPYKKRQARRKPRRVYRKKGSKYVRGGAGTIQALKTLTVPDRLKVKLPYHTIVNYTSAAGVQDYVFNINSIWDPDRSGVGHQPLGRDQWAAFYNRYRVYGVKIRWSLTNKSGVPCLMSMIGNNDPVMVLSNDSMFEQSHMNKKHVGATGGIDTKYITKYFTLPRITGRPISAYVGDDRYQATMGSNPLETIVAHLYVANADGGVTPLAANASIHITYYVELFDRVNLNWSNTAPDSRGPEKNVLEDGTLEFPPPV